MHDYTGGWYNILSFQWWAPEWMHHNIPLLPQDYPHWTDFWITIPLAILITLLRLYVSDPIATRIVTSKLGLARNSLRSENAREKDPSKHIPGWVWEEIDGFAQDMVILKKRLKKRKYDSLAIRIEKQRAWRVFQKKILSNPKSKDSSIPLTPAQLNAWWGIIKRDSLRALEIAKFNEAFWRFSFYTLIWLYGIWVGVCESWLLDIRAIWGGWPLQQVASPWVRWYYYLSFGHYVHLFVTQFFEPKRKDWWEMFIHHIVTMALLFFSYVINFVRIGTVVLLCHDGSDVFLELAKLFNYLKMGSLCDVTFSIFAVAFFVGRLVMYPWRVIYVAVVLGAEQVGVWRGFHIFVILLLVLQVLHLFWFYTIATMVYGFIATGGVEKDVREETESEAEETTGGKELDEQEEKERKTGRSHSSSGDEHSLRQRKTVAGRAQ